jgi:hypothetical protein
MCPPRPSRLVGLARLVVLVGAVAPVAACGSLLGLDADWAERATSVASAGGAGHGGAGGATSAGGHGGGATTSSGTTSAGGSGGTTSAGGSGGATSAGGSGGATTGGGGAGGAGGSPAGWPRRFYDPQASQGTAITSDAAGNVILAGKFASTLDCGDGQLHVAHGVDLFLAKLRPDGAVLWCKTFGNAGLTLGVTLATSPSGDIVVGGLVSSAVDFGGGPVAPLGAAPFNAFAARFGPDGKHVFSRTFGGGLVSGVAVTQQERVVVAISATDVLPFVKTAVKGAADAIVARLDPGGSTVDWTVPITGDDAQFAGNLALVGDEVAFLASIRGLTDIQGDSSGTPPNATGGTALLGLVSDAGGVQWKKLIVVPSGGPAPMADGVWGALWPLARTPDGDLCMAATLATSGSVTFGGSLLGGQANEVAYACYDGNGGFKKAARFSGSPSLATGFVAHPGNPMPFSLVGQTAGTLSFGGQVSPSGQQVFVARFDDTGFYQGSINAMGASSVYGQSAVAVSTKALAFTGSFTGQIDLNGSPLESDAPGGTAFVAVAAF